MNFIRSKSKLVIVYWTKKRCSKFIVLGPGEKEPFVYRVIHHFDTIYRVVQARTLKTEV